MQANEKTYRLDKWGEYNIIWINSDILKVCMDYYEKHHLDGIAISDGIGYRLKDLNFLNDYPDLRGLVVNCSEKFDLKHLKKLKSLRFLSIDDIDEDVDFSEFSELEELKAHYHKKIKFFEKSPKMKRFYLRKYNSNSKSCVELPNFPNLDTLELIQSSITSLDGISKYPKLKNISFSYCPKLTDISAVSSLSPEFLEFDRCKNISNHAVVENITSLKKLKFVNCGSTSSIKFIDNLSNLRTFCFGDTNVEDGNIEPCIRLNFAGFVSKRHYSHTCEEIKKIVAARKEKIDEEKD